MGVACFFLMTTQLRQDDMLD